MSTRSPTRPCARRSKKNALQPHRRKMWCIPDKPSAEFVYHMEDVLEVYHRPYDPKRPVVCVDETFKHLGGETRESLPMRPGRSSAMTTSTPATGLRACSWPANPSRAGAISR